MHHRVPGAGFADSSVNVMTDLARTMKHNPKMKVLLMGGYFDLGTLYFGATYEMKHLPIPDSLQKNISYKFFPTGNKVYVNEEALQGFYKPVTRFMRTRDKGK
jgi:carboxypeptidase C (cathepsin A)